MADTHLAITDIAQHHLKPLNIMVGAFGEVQVMDWGLAKVLGTAEPVTESATAADNRPGPVTDSHTIAGAAAAIWIVIKLPQEFWLHIARLDLTDVLKTALFDAPPETTWGHLFAALPWVFVGAAVAAAALIGALAWLAGRRLPGAGRSSFLSRGAVAGITRDDLLAARAAWSRTLFDRDLAEKVALVTLVVVIFAQVLPNARASTAQLVAGSAVIIVLNAALSHWLARRGVGWRNAASHFLAMAAANAAIVVVFRLLPGPWVPDNASAGFFILLLSIIVTLFDRFLEIQMARGRGGLSDRGNSVMIAAVD